jgi:dTDP-L-rhamnose 4-epimerase
VAQENILRSWGSARGVPISVLRLQNVYGPGQSLINSYTGIVSLFSQVARRGGSIPLYEDGRITRDFVFIDDVAAAFAAAIDDGPHDIRPILDVGAGVATTIEQLAVAIAAYYDAPAPHVVGKFRDGDVRHASCTIDATLNALDWAPRVGLEEGLSLLQDWIGAQLEHSTTSAAS